MSIALLLLCLTVSFAIPSAHWLSVVIGVGSCGHPNSSSMFLIWAPSCPFTNSPPNSASAADAITFLSKLLMTNMVPFTGGGLLSESGLSLPFKKKKPPTRDFASGSDRYDASL